MPDDDDNDDLNIFELNNLRYPYNSELFIERDKELEEAREWLKNSERLLTVISPPATGKTWFLQKFKENVENDTELNAVPLWINILDLIDIENENDEFGDITDQKRVDWLIQFREQVNQYQPENELPAIDPTKELTTYTAEIAEQTCSQAFPNKKVVVIIDQGDMCTEYAWQKLERFIIEPLARRSEIEFIIALRNNTRLQIPVLRLKETLMHLEPLNDSRIGRQQLTLLQNSEERNGDLDIDEFMAKYPGYSFNHFGINANLFSNYRNQDPASHRELISSVFSELHIAPRISEELFEYLVKIANEFDASWTLEDIQEKFENLSVSKSGQLVRDLRNAWFIDNLNHRSHRLQIIPEIRDFINAGLNTEGSEGHNE